MTATPKANKTKQPAAPAPHTMYHRYFLSEESVAPFLNELKKVFKIRVCAASAVLMPSYEVKVFVLVEMEATP